MAKKILIIGGVVGGASAAERLRRLSGVVDDADKLVLMNPNKFMSQYRIDARIRN